MNDVSGVPVDPAGIAAEFHRLRPESESEFRKMAAAAESFQREANPVYGAFSPFRYLPVEAFKRVPVTSFDPAVAEAVFTSSGTRDAKHRSRHFIYRLEIYRRSVTAGFRARFGNGPYRILAHLPTYEESGNGSSLVVMVQTLIEKFGTDASGFVLDPDLFGELSMSATSGADPAPLLVFGAAFGLLTLAESGRFTLPPTAMVIETGGMKTYRREITRDELHSGLAKGFGIERSAITSEYGMCELHSQFYSDSNGVFHAPPWARTEIVDPETQRVLPGEGARGALAVFDLANIYSVCGILTEDLAVRRGSGFEILGRLKGAELRGCNFLVEDRLG